ncbi:unnamed protein product [Orchesella dallaii]|uniref:Chitin-binding type-2 domain-containing protein n=1 Tax=Orchesella dallaii TaxID=48710 RepID=A0ABP1QIE8_9HEXA
MGGETKLLSTILRCSILLILGLSIQIQVGFSAIPSRSSPLSEVEALLKQLEEDGDGKIEMPKPRVDVKRQDRVVRKHGSTFPIPTSIFCRYQGKVAIPLECSKYFSCPYAEMESTVQTCPPNHLFHHQKSACLQISLNECKASMCKDPKDKFPHSYAKEKYLSCEKMYPEVKSCAEGEVFDSIAEYCVAGSPTDNLKSSSEEDRSNEENSKVPDGNDE